ncbi:hypothetical protein Tco_0343134 [Tanacetum coccineum]
MPRGDGPYKVLERIGDNAYKLELPGDSKISATFNVGDLSPYFEDSPLEDLMTNSSEPGGVDAGALGLPNPMNLISVRHIHFVYGASLGPDYGSQDLLGFKSPKGMSVISWQPTSLSPKSSP